MMAVKTPTQAPLTLFADRDSNLWGVVQGGPAPLAAVARLTDAPVELESVVLDTAEDDVWLLSGPHCDLRIERAAPTTAVRDADAGLDPCRISGSVQLDGHRRELDVGGLRSTAAAGAAQDSVRLFGAWFPAGHEVGLLAARPRGAREHDRDSFDVVALGEEHPLVVDPRLSTTYDAAGNPRRVGIELWLGEDPDGELWPRRVAGQSTGSVAAGSGLTAYAFDCVSRGEAGAGVYVLLAP
jgi:hypothetical protein